MVKAQEWLDREYPKEFRSEVEEIYLSEPSLEGKLDLEDFTYWNLKIYVSSDLDESQLILQNKPWNARVIKCINAQIWLDQNYPKYGTCGWENKWGSRNNNFGKARSEITRLDISKQNLESTLDLVGFSNLRELSCYNNQLTSLDLKDCEKLETLWCGNNQLASLILPTQSNLKILSCSDNLLTNLNWDALWAEKLVSLNLANNNFPSQDLSCLSRFINLGWLYLGNDDAIKFKQGIYNRWVGSLKYLRDMSKLLWHLDISNTDLNSGVEALPMSLIGYNKITYSTQARPTSKVKEITKLLDLFTNGNYKNWKKLGFAEAEINSWLEIGLKVYEYNLANQWKQSGFDSQQTKQWINIGLTIHDYEIANYFQNRKNLTPQAAQQENLKWKTIHSGFTWQLQKEWEEKGFNYEQVKNLINNTCLTPNDFDFAYYLVKQGNSIKEIINLDNLAELKARYQKFGLCAACRQINSGWDWCQFCVNELIQKPQLEATNKFKEFKQWIPYQQFTNIQHLTNGGFSRVYRARWKSQVVILKALTNSQNITSSSFLQEVTNYKLFSSRDNIVQCYGISREPITGNYIMIMDYMEGGDLRKYLRNNYSRLEFETKFIKLSFIARGLKNIHDQGLVHKDFHTGNILSRIGVMRYSPCYISDLGLCRPVNETDNSKVYGVLPYIAPEVLRGEPYTQAADIYSFGMVATEVLTGCPPFAEYAHDTALALRICAGLRPEFKIKIPQLLADLISRCWNADPRQRPTANQLNISLFSWQVKIYDENEFAYQLRESEKYNQSLPEEIRFPNYKLHPQAIYTSRLIDTKSITEQLTNSAAYSLEFNLNNDQDLTNRTKRQLSFNSQISNSQEKTKQLKITAEQIYCAEPMDLDDSWITIHPSFTSELSQAWQNYGFTAAQARDWININSPSEQEQAIQEPAYYAWLRDTKQVDSEWVHNYGDTNLLKQEYQEYLANQLETKIEIPPKRRMN